MKKWSFFKTKELKPGGWLYRQLRIQAEGLSGNLDKVWPDVRDSAWIGGDREGWERVPYWLDGFIPLAYLLEDEDMIGRAQRYIDAIIDGQQPDGWICPCSEDARKSYDTWAVQLITKVLTVYYNCSGDGRVPEVLYRVLKNYHDLLKSDSIRLFGWGHFRWFEVFIAINFTYERYREEWLIDLARIVKEQGADYESFTDLWKRPLNKWILETHVVNLAMMLKSEAVSCEMLGESYTDKAERLLEILHRHNKTAVETFTGDECLSGVSAIQGTELCGVVEQMYSYEQLFAYTGDVKWLDRLEVLAFNALPAAISEDMWTHQYLQMNNQIACIRFPGRPVFRTNNGESHLFGLEPLYGCCTANFNQGWPKLALSAFMYSGDTVASVLPLPGELTTDDVSVTVDTCYPFGTDIKYTVSTKKDITFAFRLPKDAERITVNGEAGEGTFCSVELKAGESTELDVRFELTPHFEKYADGLNYVKLGSMVFSLPIEYDKKMYEYEKDGVERKFPYCDYELIPKSEWSYGFADASLETVIKSPGDYPFSESAPAVTVRARMQRIDWGLEDGFEHVCARVPLSVDALSEPEEIELIPYGAAKLRMTLMPFTK